MVEPSFLALTTTPSIRPALAELTWPDSAAAVCAKSGEGAGNTRATRPAAAASNNVVIRTWGLLIRSGREPGKGPSVRHDRAVCRSVDPRLQPLKDALCPLPVFVGPSELTSARSCALISSHSTPSGGNKDMHSRRESGKIAMRRG